MRSLALSFAFFTFAVTASLADQPPKPARVSAEGCSWSWKQGAGIGFWSQDCDINTGKWRVDFDTATNRFVMTIDGKDPMPLVYVFDKDKAADISSLAPKLRMQKLILDTDECQFMPDADNTLAGGRLAYQVMPTGKLKEAFDKSPDDEVPEPPCGELGFLPDAAAYFMVDPKFPGKVVYLMLGQDEPMFEPDSIRFDAD